MSMSQPHSTLREDEAAQAALLRQLRKRQAQSSPAAAPKAAWSLEFGGPSRRQLAVSTRQLATLIAANVPLVRALELVAAQAGHRGLGQAFEGVAERVRSGVSFAQALAARPGLFNRLYVNLVQVGEHAGLLAEVLNRLAGHLEQTDALRRRVQGALMYPAIILLVAAGATLVLMLEVIPLFADLFRHASVPLPLPTRLVIELSEGVQQYWLWLMMFVGVGVLLTRMVAAHPRGRLLIDRMQLGLPLVGRLLHASALARFTRSLGTLLCSGVPLTQALEATRETLVNRYLEQTVMAAQAAVGRGEGLARALSGAPGWPEMVAHLLSVGEETGRLAPVLAHLAEYYTNETEHLIQTLTAVLEPLLIVVVAVLIGGLLVAMYLPIFNLSDVVA